MPTGISIHVGVNRPDPHVFPDLSQLEGCVNDAEAMQRLADRAGFATQILRGPEATAAAVLGAIEAAVQPVGSDGTLLLTYSGHGSIVKKCNPIPPRKSNEAFCVFDREVLDRELLLRFSRFHAGARIVVVADSCFSGDIVQLAPTDDEGSGARGSFRRALSNAQSAAVVRDAELFAHICKETPDIDPSKIAPSVLLLAAAADNRPAKDGPLGVYTRALLDTWRDGDFGGSYSELHDTLYTQLEMLQPPVIKAIGGGPSFHDTPAFRIERSELPLAA